MKQVLLLNGLNIILLAGLLAVYIVIGCPLWFLVIFGIWVLYMIILNIHLLREDDIKANLLKVDTKKVFTPYVREICNALDSVEFYREVFSSYPPDNSIHQTFEYLDKKAYQNAERAYRWIKTYNHIVSPSQKYIVELANNSYEISQKLSELNELMIKVEDSTSDIDITYVDDLLLSLKELLEGTDENE